MAILNGSASLQGSGSVLAEGGIITEATIQVSGTGTITANSLKQSLVSTYMNGTGTLNVNVIKRIITSSQATGIGQVIINAEAWRFKGIKTNLSGEGKLEFYIYDRDIQSDLKMYTPPDYDVFDEVKYMRIALANEFTRLNAIIQNLLQQNSINTATWGIDLREKLIGLSSLGKTLIERQNKLKSLMAADTFKLDGISSYIGVECQPTGIAAEYLVNILLTGVRGEPSNIKEINEMIDKILPSHLNYTMDYSYLPWSEVETAGLTWEQADTYTMHDLERAFLI